MALIQINLRKGVFGTDTLRGRHHVQMKVEAREILLRAQECQRCPQSAELDRGWGQGLPGEEPALGTGLVCGALLQGPLYSHTHVLGSTHSLHTVSLTLDAGLEVLSLVCRWEQRAPITRLAVGSPQPRLR